MGATQHKIKTGIDISYFLDVMTGNYDLIWCEGDASHLACFIHSIFKARSTHDLHRFYRSNRAKIVSRFHYHEVKPYLQIFKWKAIMALTTSDKTVCVSEYWRNEIIKLLPFLKEVTEMKIVHNGVDTSKYVPNPNLKENNTIFYLAVTNTRKRLHLLIQALKYLKDWKLIIGGKCSKFEVATEEWEDPTVPPEYRRDNEMYWSWCHKLSETYKNRVYWTGFLSDEDKIRMYQKATVFCLPSVVENWAVTAMEAMACGTPVIVTKAGGMPEFVPQKQLLPPMPTTKEIADKIVEAQRFTEWGQQNREIIRNYDWKNIAKEVHEVLEGVGI